jgi:hypothetical protein
MDWLKTLLLQCINSKSKQKGHRKRVLKEGARGWLSPGYNYLLTAQKSWSGLPLHKRRTHSKLLNSDKLIETLLNDTSRRYHRKFPPKQITQGTNASQIWHKIDC